LKTSKKPFPPPLPKTTKDDAKGQNFPVMVVRIRTAGVDYLFFGPLMTVRGDLEEIEVMGLTTKESVIRALEQGSAGMEREGVVVQ